MNRGKISFSQLLQLLLEIPGVSRDERSRIQAAVLSPSRFDLEGLAAELIETLADRGLLRVLPGREPGTRRVESPSNRRAFHLSGLPTPRIRRIDPATLPEVDDSRAIPLSELEGIGWASGPDLRLDPRELVTRLEEDFSRIAGTGHMLFFPTEGPSEWDALRQDEGRVLLCKRFLDTLPLPDEITLAPDLARFGDSEAADRPEGALLVIGVGSARRPWRGVVEWFSARPLDFPPERVSLCRLLSRLLAGRMTSSLELQAMVFEDVVTGIYNRTYFRLQVEKEIQLAGRKSEPMALCIIDIDGFKAVNTRYGYDGGDRVLREVALRLRQSVRGTDVVARHGGDEFGALLAAPCQPEEAIIVAERLSDAARAVEIELQTLGGEPEAVSASVSIGGAVFPRDGESFRDLWLTANRELVKAKEKGKDQWSFPQEPSKKVPDRTTEGPPVGGP